MPQVQFTYRYNKKVHRKLHSICTSYDKKEIEKDNENDYY